MQPKIVTHPAIQIIGIKYRGENQNEDIPQLWQEFVPRQTEIGTRKEHRLAYGVISNFDEEQGEFDDVAGVEVSQIVEIPPGMVAIELPEQSYAVFECNQPTLMETMREIYTQWLPQSSYRRAAGPEFELYHERFDPQQDQMKMAVYFPVQKG